MDETPWATYAVNSDDPQYARTTYTQAIRAAGLSSRGDTVTPS